MQHNLDAAVGGRFAYGLKPSDVEEFREILRAEWGEDVTIEEAWTRSTEVLAVITAFLDKLTRASEARASSNVAPLD